MAVAVGWQAVGRVVVQPGRQRRVTLRGLLVGALLAISADVAGAASRPHTPVHATSQALVRPQVSPRLPCHPPRQQLRMMTPQELAHPVTVGYEVHGQGYRVECVRAGLAIPRPPHGTPQAAGQVILVSTGMQWLWAYEDGKLMFANPVTTGGEWRWTPQGTYHVLRKVADTWFTSPWPPGSRWYYEPVHVNYALYFREGGYYLHDAPWRHAFGPGTNVPHTSPDGTREDGSHGCVNVTTAAGEWLFGWARIGATVIITG